MIYKLDFTSEDIARVLVKEFAHRFDEHHHVAHGHILMDGTQAITNCSNCNWHFIREYCLMDDATEKFYCLNCCLKRVIANKKKTEFYMSYDTSTYWVDQRNKNMIIGSEIE